MAKRPSGFGKASKQKKQKSEEVSPNSEGKPDEEPEVNIELPDETSDDELSEVYGLYAKLREERDPRIARGLVHESDQLLRSRDAKGDTLPAKFHVAYGAALLTLADPEIGEKEEHSKFGDAGISRLTVGLESSEKLAVEVRALAASELVQFVHTQLKEGAITKKAKKHIETAQGLLKCDDTHIELARASISLLQLAEDCADESNLSEIAKSVLENQLESADQETTRVAHEGLGQYYLNAIAPAMDALEDEEVDNDSADHQDDEANENVKADLETALKHLKQAVTDTKPNTFVMLAETLLQWSNFVEESEEEKVYADALTYLKKAQMLGVENLREVIESLENPEE